MAFEETTGSVRVVRTVQVMEKRGMKNQRLMFGTLTAGMCLAVAGSAMAQDVTVNGVNIRNDFGEFSPTYDIGNTFDQSGLDANYVSGVTEFDMFVARTSVITTGNEDDSWFGTRGATLPGNIDFDLGATFTVTQLALWSFVNNDENCFDEFEVYVSDNVAFSSATFAGSFVFVNSASVNPRPSQVFDLTDISGRYVRLRLMRQNTNLVGIGEIVFGAVPAPSSVVLLGLAGLVLARRRRQA
ncbi:MAG: PEP-CTERM sorting domain-containing protein [Planctomycetes bacterium]|nr:PEP-CTERM sorting domain-containing protein [Planctomycetota bacterium]